MREVHDAREVLELEGLPVGFSDALVVPSGAHENFVTYVGFQSLRLRSLCWFGSAHEHSHGLMLVGLRIHDRELGQAYPNLLLELWGIGRWTFPPIEASTSTRITARLFNRSGMPLHAVLSLWGDPL